MKMGPFSGHLYTVVSAKIEHHESSLRPQGKSHTAIQDCQRSNDILEDDQPKQQ